MDIQINSHPVSFDLEQERNVAEVVTSVSRWAQARDFVFIEAYIDDVGYTVDRIPDVSIDRVERLNCIVQSKADVVISSIEEGIRYCDRVIDFAHKAAGAPARKEQAEALAGGIVWIKDMVTSVLTLLSINIGTVSLKDRGLETILKELDELRDAAEARESERMIGLFTELKNAFRLLLMSENLKMLVIQSLDSPDVLIDALKEIRKSIPGQRENLSSAAAAYQSGKDGEAAERLQRFIDFIFGYIRTCHQTSPVFQVNLRDVAIEGVSLEEKNGAIQQLLAEMHNALENNDMVSLSDILEYELNPAFGNIERYIDLLIEKIGS